GGTADRNRSHWSTSKTPSYTKSVSWHHHPRITHLRQSKIIEQRNGGIQIQKNRKIKNLAAL
ncbi:hypothetical protein SNC27_01650, partial [Escherichia coli]|nr:hypothetical protein [Escherichia coli]MDZ9634733.1 hypothetical protein [Escherichia coli]MEA0499534.1 hypothetical protein [Escherichia coli]